MYSMLQRNLNGYFSSYNEGDEHYRYQVAEVLKGLMSKEIYDRWKVEAPEKYAEVNRLVYYIKQYTPQFPRFETLNWDLWGMGYQAMPSNGSLDEHLLEKLKIVNMCLGAAYL